jgi:nitrous oxide reductase
MKSSETKPNRRHFLLGATLGTAATAAAIVTGKSVNTVGENAADAPVKAEAEQTGYRLTPRIQQYYETTKL